MTDTSNDMVAEQRKPETKPLTVTLLQGRLPHGYYSVQIVGADITKDIPRLIHLLDVQRSILLDEPTP